MQSNYLLPKMSSEKQIIANRKNGKLGWPKTQKWKMVVRRNALKHWITARILFDEEDQKEYNEILHKLCDEYNPQGFSEVFLVETMAVSAYRKMRLLRAEDAYFLRASQETNIYRPTEEDLCE